MSRIPDRLEEAAFRRVARVKQAAPREMPALGPELVAFFKGSVQKRQTKFAKIGDCWAQLVPQTLADHAALESFHRGTLTVLVDSASHLYELKQLLLAGLEKQFQLACASTGLRKIVLKPGRWYDVRTPDDGGGPAVRKPKFE